MSDSDIEAQLAALKEKARRFDEEAPNFSLAKLLEHEKEDPMGVWDVLCGPVGELLALEDPTTFRALKLRSESHMLHETLRALFARLPVREQRLFACDCVRRALSLSPQITAEEDRPLRMVELTERYARGELTTEEFMTASDFMKGVLFPLVTTIPDKHKANLLVAAQALRYDSGLFDAVSRSATSYPAEDMTLCVEERRWQLSHLKAKFSS